MAVPVGRDSAGTSGETADSKSDCTYAVSPCFPDVG